MVAVGLWTGNAQAQTSWLEHGTVEQWTREGDRWHLNASVAGTASLILLPNETMNTSTGCTFRVRWHQGFSGSGANFTRLHWLLDSAAWSTSPESGVPASGWSVSEDHGPLTFMHVGETGTNDSIRWFSPGPSGSWDSIVSRVSRSHFPASFDLELTWRQWPGSDSARITLAHVFEDESRSALEFAAHAAHEVPVGIGFSANFTASNADAASFEILEYGPYVPDTVAPALKGARWESGHGLQLTFSEPMNPHAGRIRGGYEHDSLPLFWLSPPSHNGFTLPAHPIDASAQFSLTGFQDLSGQPLSDTLINVDPVKPWAEVGDVVITECMIESSTQGEWIEVLNGTERTVDLSNLRIWDGSTNASKALVPRFGWDGLLAPSERSVLANQWAPWMAEHSPFLFATIQPSMTLSNTGETIGLRSSAGTTIDEVTFSNDWWPAGETIGLQKKHPLGCTLQDNWIVLGDASECSPGLPSLREWPPDTSFQLVAESAIALGPGAGMFELNQPLHPGCMPVIKGGWAWGDEQRPSVLLWRIDSLAENSTWPVTVSAVRGCFNAAPSTLKASLDVAKFPTDGDLIITEIAHDPKGVSSAWGMFVELFNPSETEAITLAGCTVNGISLHASPSLPPLGRVCVPIALGRKHGRIEVRNHEGEVVDAVAYSRCWHPQRNQSEAGFSLVRLQPRAGRVHPGAWWAWTTSAEAATGCSPGGADLAESGMLALPTTSAIACGDRNGKRVIAFTAPVQLEPPWIPLDSLDNAGMVWSNPTGEMEPYEALCPAMGAALDGKVRLNEVRKWVSGGAEPFIELANPFAEWVSTEGLDWTSAAVPFPDDWKPVSAETHWFIPPQTTVAFAACPSRIASAGQRSLPAELPSLWGSLELRLAQGGNELDAFIFNSEMEAPWHTPQHSIEKTTRNAHQDGAHWTTAASAAGHTAGSWNSWQLQPDWNLNSNILQVIQSTGFASSTGEVVPISFQVNAPNEEAWEVQWTIENSMGTSIASSGTPPAVVDGNQPLVCRWDGASGGSYAARGPYLLKVALHSLQSQRMLRSQAPVYVCPH